MNCIFAAKKTGVLLDTCVLGNKDSVHLKQASHLTGGVYIRPRRERLQRGGEGPSVLLESGGQTALLHHMILSFLPDHYCRQYLNMPMEESVDLSASCFGCHKLKDVACGTRHFLALRSSAAAAFGLHCTRSEESLCAFFSVATLTNCTHCVLERFFDCGWALFGNRAAEKRPTEGHSAAANYTHKLHSQTTEACRT